MTHLQEISILQFPLLLQAILLTISAFLAKRFKSTNRKGNLNLILAGQFLTDLSTFPSNSWSAQSDGRAQHAQHTRGGVRWSNANERMSGYLNKTVYLVAKTSNEVMMHQWACKQADKVWLTITGANAEIHKTKNDHSGGERNVYIGI